MIVSKTETATTLVLDDQELETIIHGLCAVSQWVDTDGGMVVSPQQAKELEQQIIETCCPQIAR